MGEKKREIVPRECWISLRWVHEKSRMPLRSFSNGHGGTAKSRYCLSNVGCGRRAVLPIDTDGSLLCLYQSSSSPLAPWSGCFNG